jgi:DNA-directed RNA polymerase I, II, and III subunit RPABC3
LRQESEFSLALASTLHPDGVAKDAGASGGWRADIEGGLADDWDYVMYGKVSNFTLLARSPADFVVVQVYKYDEGSGEEVTAYVSFGGLLMALTGVYRHMTNLTVGEYVYLLLRPSKR